MGLVLVLVPDCCRRCSCFRSVSVGSWVYFFFDELALIFMLDIYDGYGYSCSVPVKYLFLNEVL